MDIIVGSDSGNYNVHLGFWINWSFGRMNGATLTMTREKGGLFIAFLALYVSTCGRSFWRLGCFLLHRAFSSSKPQDGLHHQRQALLRNSDTATQSMWTLACAIKAWRKRARRPIFRILPLLVFALLVSSAFTVAGLFSSRITTNTANEVLLSGKNCGILYRGTFTQEMVDIYMNTSDLNEVYSSQRNSAYLNYASQCYTTTGESESETCRPYVKPRLKFTSTTNAACPFEEDICLLKSGNIMMDSGPLDSERDFGLNSRPDQRFSFRMRTECAPIKTEGFTKLHQSNTTNKPDSIRYYYGQALGIVSYRDPSFTYQTVNDMSIRKIDNYTSIQSPWPDYVISSVTNDQFEPISQLYRADGDTSLLFLSAPGLSYINPTDDPWFSAHTTPNDSTKGHVGTQTVTLYNRDEPAGVMGCFSQFQFCNPSLPESSRCEPLNGTNANYFEPLDSLWKSERDRSFIKWAKNLVYASLAQSPEVVYSTAGTPALLVRKSLRAAVQNGKIPSNQWQLEMQRLFEISLASFQGTFVDNINGPSSQEFEPAFAKPTDPAWREICKSQKIVSTLYYSFNVLGMSIILVLGGLFILLDSTIEPLANWYDKRRHNSTYSRLEWNVNSTLQLQRLVYEEAGFGTWSHCSGNLPLTEYGEKLGTLTTANPKHPKINVHDLEAPSTSQGSLDLAVSETEVQTRRSFQIDRIDSGETVVEDALEKLKSQSTVECRSQQRQI